MKKHCYFCYIDEIGLCDICIEQYNLCINCIMQSRLCLSCRQLDEGIYIDPSTHDIIEWIRENDDYYKSFL